MLMPYDVLEKKIECLTVEQQQSVFDYVDFLFSKNSGAQKKSISVDLVGLLENSLWRPILMKLQNVLRSICNVYS